jgi:RNA-dependent RNA polymerase
MESSVKISREIIINLSENGVPSGLFSDLLCQSLQDTVSSLLDWDGKDAMFRLWGAVAREGNVIASRIARESAWTARASGIHWQLGDQEDDSYDDESSSLHSVAWWGDEISGCPSSLEETVMAFLDSGFHPSSNAILSEKLCIVTKKAVKTCISKSRIKVPMSCRALIVPGIFSILFF